MSKISFEQGFVDYLVKTDAIVKRLLRGFVMVIYGTEHGDIRGLCRHFKWHWVKVLKSTHNSSTSGCNTNFFFL